MPSLGNLLDLNTFLVAYLYGTDLEFVRVPPRLSGTVVFRHFYTSSVRRKCPLKRGNYSFVDMRLLDYQCRLEYLCARFSCLRSSLASILNGLSPSI